MNNDTMKTIGRALNKLARKLTKTEAQHVYAAMVALNPVGGRVSCNIDRTNGEGIEVIEMQSGAVVVIAAIEGGISNERYASQAAFAAAYGIEQGAPQ